MNPIEAVDWLQRNARRSLDMEYGELLTSTSCLYAYCAQAALRPEMRDTEEFHVAWYTINYFRKRRSLEPFRIEYIFPVDAEIVPDGGTITVEKVHRSPVTAGGSGEIGPLGLAA